MNKFVKLSLMLALLACGACKADQAGLCKPLCDQEKRQCRSAAVKLDDHDGESLMARRAPASEGRYFGDGGNMINAPAGPEVRNAQARRMKRSSACDDGYAVCTKACSSAPVASDVLVKPAR